MQLKTFLINAYAQRIICMHSFADKLVNKNRENNKVIDISCTTVSGSSLTLIVIIRSLGFLGSGFPIVICAPDSS